MYFLTQDFKALESKLMELDRENPAFILLPDSPSVEKESESTQFEFDQTEIVEPEAKLCKITLSKSSSDYEYESHENLEVNLE